jgi:hypothetical protein
LPPPANAREKADKDGERPEELANCFYSSTDEKPKSLKEQFKNAGHTPGKLVADEDVPF